MWIINYRYNRGVLFYYIIKQNNNDWGVSYRKSKINELLMDIKNIIRTLRLRNFRMFKIKI